MNNTCIYALLLPRATYGVISEVRSIVRFTKSPYGPRFSILFMAKAQIQHFRIEIGFPLRRPDPISCRKWDVLYFMTLKKKIANFYVAYVAIYSNNTLTNECWK